MLIAEGLSDGKRGEKAAVVGEIAKGWISGGRDELDSWVGVDIVQFDCRNVSL